MGWWRSGLWWTTAALQRAVAQEPSRTAGPADRADEPLRRQVEQAAVSVTGAVVLATDLEGRVCYFNAAAERLTGWTEAELLGRSVVGTLLPEDEVPEIRQRFARLGEGQVPDNHENEWLTRDGRRRRLAFANTVLCDDVGRPTHAVATGIDVTVERQAQQLSQAVLAATTEQAVVATDFSGRITLFNAGAERMLGHTAEQALGADVVELLHVREELAERAARRGVPVESVVAAGALAGGASTDTWTYRRRDGSTLAVALSVTALRSPKGRMQGYLGVAVDVTAQREREEELARALAAAAHLAAHDPLTGLANRGVLLDRLAHALATARRHDRCDGLLFLDVDGLKQINDAHGHAAGDALLVEVARRLSSSLRGGDLCARLSGDEFAVLLEDLSSPLELERAADRVRALLAEPMRLPGDGTTVPSASVGQALLGADDTPASVLARADASMYAVKAKRSKP